MLPRNLICFLFVGAAVAGEQINPDAPLQYGSSMVLPMSMFVSGPPQPLRYLQPQLRHWKMDEWTSEPFVRCLLRSRTGYLWTGTMSGLARFDGRKFIAYTKRTNPELISAEFRYLAEDSSGVLWGVTAEQVVRLKNGKFEAVDLGNGLRAGEVINLCATSDGSIWFGLNSGLQCYRDGLVTAWKSEVVTRSPGLCEDRAGGRLWISGNGIQYIELQGTNAKPSVKKIYVAGIDTDWLTQDASGALWLGLGEHKTIYRWKDQKCEDLTGSFSPPIPLDSRAITDANGGLWVYTKSRSKLIRYSTSTFKAEEDYNVGPQTLLSDRDGNIWGGSDTGLFQRPNHFVATLSLESSNSPQSEAWSVFQAKDGDVWIGTDRGLSRLQEETVQQYTFTSSQFHPPLSLAIRAIGQDESGDIWAASPHYLYRLRKWVSGEPREAQIFFVPSHFNTMSLAADGQMRFYSFNELIVKGDRMHAGGRDFGLPDLTYISAFHTRSGETWYGTDRSGIFRRSRGELTHLTTKDGLPSDLAGVVHEDEDGALWILTERGICRYKSGRFSTIGRSKGLTEEFVLSLLDDQCGGYWFNSRKGIFRVAKKDLNEVADGVRRGVEPEVYGTDDGAPSEEGSAAGDPSARRTRDGRLWFPTHHGVAVIKPVQPRARAVALIEQVRANNLPSLREALLGEQSSIEIGPGHASTLAFEYGAIEFNSPDKVSFKYRLVGHDKDWIDAGEQRLAHYSDLSPGRYQFQVTTRNRNGHWKETTAAISLTLLPFLHQTLGYRIGLAVGILAPLVLAILNRLKTQRRIFQLEQANAVARERERIARDLHDDVGASLTRIALLSQVAHKQIEQAENPSTQIEKISEISGEVVDSIGGVVWAANPKYDNIESMAAYFREYAAEYLGPLGIDLHFDSNVDQPSRHVSGEFRREMFLVLKEALNNVGKHSRARKVDIGLRLEAARIVLCISDDGRGLDHERSGECQNGLVNMRDRMQRLGGEFGITSGRTGGVRITVKTSVPYVKKRLDH